LKRKRKYHSEAFVVNADHERIVDNLLPQAKREMSFDGNEFSTSCFDSCVVRRSVASVHPQSMVQLCVQRQLEENALANKLGPACNSTNVGGFHRLQMHRQTEFTVGVEKEKKD
jgi:hypothetical protein